MLADVLSLFPREAWSPFTSSSRHDSWCTPRWMVDLILALWPEGIDVDPTSNEHSIIPARTAYDGTARERDGLLASWRGEAPPTRRAHAFCNPPYSNPGPWYERAAHQALTAEVDVLLLVNVTTATRAFNRFRPRQPPEPFEVELELCRNGTSDLPRASAIGFFHRRIGFLDAGAPIKSNEYEQMILYWGPDAELFREVFAPAAWCPGGAPVRSPVELESSHPRNEAHMQPQAHPWTDGRLMSFAMTTTQLVDGTKTVTRRHGWKNLKVGARLRAVHKAMGLRRGESPHVLAVIEIVGVRREPLNAITDDDVAREGFPAMNAAGFVAMFLSKVGGVEHAEVTVIEFRVVWRPGAAQVGLYAQQEARP